MAADGYRAAKLTPEQIEAWREWYRTGKNADFPAGSFFDLCDMALDSLRPESGESVTAPQVRSEVCAAELIEDLIERNKEWWRTKSHCAGEMRELGVPDDADATQVTMSDLYRLQKAIEDGI